MRHDWLKHYTAGVVRGGSVIWEHLNKEEPNLLCMVTQNGGCRMPGQAALASSNSNKPFFFLLLLCQSNPLQLLLQDMGEAEGMRQLQCYVAENMPHFGSPVLACTSSLLTLLTCCQEIQLSKLHPLFVLDSVSIASLVILDMS